MSEPIKLYRGAAVRTVYAPSQADVMIKNGWSRTPPPARPVEAPAADTDDEAANAPTEEAETAPAKKKRKGS